MRRWVALLRGINVGGGNRLAMADLRATAESLGWTDVSTYIQSGNLVFAAEGAEAELSAALVGAVRERHALDVPVVVRPADDIARIAASHPSLDTGIEPKFLHVQLLDRAPDPAVVGAVDTTVFEPDTWVLDGREVYVTYPDGSGRSKLTIEVFERAWDVTATARNLNSMRKIAELAGG